MSMILCKGCGAVVDSDAHPEGWIETKYGDEYFCPFCRDRIEAQQDKADRACSEAEDRSAALKYFGEFAKLNELSHE